VEPFSALHSAIKSRIDRGGISSRMTAACAAVEAGSRTPQIRN
jgi:hypothetical protein